MYIFLRRSLFFIVPCCCRSLPPCVRSLPQGQALLTLAGRDVPGIFVILSAFVTNRGDPEWKYLVTGETLNGNIC